jgi:type IV secretion system protein VirB10
MPVEETCTAPPAETGPSETEQALMESLATLQAELAELRARPAETAGDAGAEAIAELTAQIAALQEASAEAQRALERQLTERDRELDQLRMDLEVASADPSREPGTSGNEEKTQRLAELERRRIAEAEARAERIASPMIAFSGMGSDDRSRREQQEAARLNEDEAFVRAGADPHR